MPSPAVAFVEWKKPSTLPVPFFHISSFLATYPFPFVSRGRFASRRRVCFRIRGCIRYFRSSFRLVTRISIQRSGLIETVSYRDNNKQPCIHIRTYMYTHVHIYAHASVST